MFRHKALDDPSADIRLLKISGNGDDSDDIDCSLTSYARSEAPEYVALSYVWGLDGADSNIMLNGEPFAVRPNLARCLQQLRRHDWDHYYWIDAICINQDDNDERSAQVRSMSSIFRNAIFVASWLGELDTGSSQAIDFLKSDLQTWHTIYETTRGDCTEMSETISALCNRPYWRRLWVVQEIKLAREVRILCGNEVIPWQQLENFLAFLHSVQEAKKDTFRERSKDMPNDEYDPAVNAFNSEQAPHEAILQSDAARFRQSDIGDGEDRGYNADRAPTLITLIARYHGYTLCHDLRDKVYGLLALDPECDEFVPDYSPECRAWDTYLNIMLYLNTRHPDMPAIYVSHVIQRALLIQSHDPLLVEALDHSPRLAHFEKAHFVDTVKEMFTVERVGVYMQRPCSTSPDSLEMIRDSLDLSWTDANESFCGRDFTAAQKHALRLLIQRDDMFATTSFNFIDGSRGLLCWPGMEKSSLAIFEAEETSHERDFDYRFFMSEGRCVGLACNEILPGDIVLSTLGRHAPLIVARRYAEDVARLRLIGRCYTFLIADDREQHAAKEDADIDMLHLKPGDVPSTYWKPQVTNMSPAYDKPNDEDTVYTLLMNTEALLTAGSLAEYWISASNESWWNESMGKPSRDARSGTLGRIYILAEAPGQSDDDSDEEYGEDEEDGVEEVEGDESEPTADSNRTSEDTSNAQRRECSWV